MRGLRLFHFLNAVKTDCFHTVLLNDRDNSRLSIFFVLSVTVRALLLVALHLTSQFSAY